MIKICVKCFKAYEDEYPDISKYDYCEECRGVLTEFRSPFVREIRDLSHVPRWGIIRTIRTQNVAEHSYYVTLYAFHIAKMLSWGDAEIAALMHKALYHDAAESFTGDIPGTTKRHLQGNGVVFQQFLERETTLRFPGFPVGRWLTPGEARVIKAADLLDEVLFLSGEQQLGNNAIYSLLAECQNRLRKAWWNLFSPEVTPDEIEDSWKRYVEKAIRAEQQMASKLVINNADVES